MDKNQATGIGIGTGLMLLTVVGMLLLVGTPVATAILTLFKIPLVGMIVFGVLISVSHYLAVNGVENGNDTRAVGGTALLVGAFSSFGAGVLSPFSPTVYLYAIVVTGGLTALLSLIAGAYVSETSHDLSHWQRYAGVAFLGALLTAGLGLLFEFMYIATFVFVLAGFIAELVYEVWNLSQSARSPLASGIALYVAFAGVFVQLLQLVLRVVARQD